MMPSVAVPPQFMDMKVRGSSVKHMLRILSVEYISNCLTSYLWCTRGQGKVIEIPTHDQFSSQTKASNAAGAVVAPLLWRKGIGASFRSDG